MTNKKGYKEQKKFFTRFLKEHGVYARYLRYIKSPLTYNIYQQDNEDWTFDKCAKLYGIKLMVSRLISWSKTKEGFDFWQKLHEVFKKEYENKFEKS